ncbi:3' terminal RNA ribose 2'-O-methyltransferase Hen1 (plasmid) [Asticcacaulis sp. DW145]|jgi:3' terminal RNA ribose 2'-O-methyltransferase Hen1|uniref:3' terminal RNA ribose 2'-O-methyltransferase Hen1 n=1 Tax=Asticcacaulis sp. DW145 TaxID=3095608 RepID=UPI003088B576|nr:3' terminal RNA ribose 2'-O-methyltransferase Hen1 [Asticcacaulis sp. DW145]
MLLTISTTHRPATDLGYLLHKNPQRLHSQAFGFGQAHVFYPEAREDLCTAALLLEVDPIGLVRKSGPSGEGFALEQYVNDRPYVASSFLSVALGQFFRTAMTGRSKDRQELADTAIPYEIRLPVLPCRGGETVLRRLFEPLGYAVCAERLALDEAFPAWGDSAYFDVTLSIKARLADILRHLYVLIPVLDQDKHYWIGDDEVEKLLRHGEGWLDAHPDKELIARRYLKSFKGLTAQAMERLSDGTSEPDPVREGGQEETLERKINLNQQRLEWVIATLKRLGAKSVVDMGCGEGKLIGLMAKDIDFDRISGCDVSVRALEIARERLNFDRMPEFQQQRITLMQSALTYRDKRLTGYDAATVIEVIEHLEPDRVDAFARSLFEYAKPGVVILTTPNAEYNALFENLPSGKFRHPDHRFEWTRAEFEAWAQATAVRFGYAVTFDTIGQVDERLGAPTQAGIFRKL